MIVDKCESNLFTQQSDFHDDSMNEENGVFTYLLRPLEHI